MFSRLRIFRKRIAMVLIITNLQLFDALSSQNHVHFIKIFYSFALWHAQLASEVDHAALGRQLACREHRELDILVFGPPEFALELVHLAHLHLEKLLCPPLVERVPVQQLELGSLLSQLVHLVDLFVVDCRRTCSRLRHRVCARCLLFLIVLNFLVPPSSSSHWLPSAAPPLPTANKNDSSISSISSRGGVTRALSHFSPLEE